MFTGLVEGTAILQEVIPETAGVRLVFEFHFPTTPEVSPINLGDSVSISGCCLTVVDIQPTPRDPEVTNASADTSSSSEATKIHLRVAFQAGEETLSKTRLGELTPGSRVNYERSLRVGDRMGGHFVTGHIDGLGHLIQRQDDGQWSYFFFSAPLPLLRQMVNKGSITIDGVSLTVVSADDSQFSIALIPHTLSVTTLGQLREGDYVNLETDILAKYVQRIQR
ncbi:MAG: riboflavin synthase [Planctomycetota bacterium]|nr:riboflavin synthase [Planctomycetota bacterium]